MRIKPWYTKSAWCQIGLQFGVQHTLMRCIKLSLNCINILPLMQWHRCDSKSIPSLLPKYHRLLPMPAHISTLRTLNGHLYLTNLVALCLGEAHAFQLLSTPILRDKRCHLSDIYPSSHLSIPVTAHEPKTRHPATKHTNQHVVPVTKSTRTSMPSLPQQIEIYGTFCSDAFSVSSCKTNESH